MLKRRRDRAAFRMFLLPFGLARIHRMRKRQGELHFALAIKLLPGIEGGLCAENVDDFEHAVLFSATGWPAYEVLYGVGGPGSYLEHKLPDGGNFRKLPHTHSCIRQQGVEPISAALVAAGAA